jgi:uncharacterized membrane protein YidH (DUF202 family)
MKKKYCCKDFKTKRIKKEKLSEKIVRNVKEYNFSFFKQFIFGFVMVAILTYILGYFKWFSSFINFEISDKEFEIIATIIGFLGILLGFLLTALGIIVSGVQNRYSNEKDSEEKAKLNDYWKYLIIVSKTVVFLLVGYILIYIICLTQIDTFRIYNAQLYLISWSVLSMILICYLVFDRVFDYYENPF